MDVISRMVKTKSLLTVLNAQWNMVHVRVKVDVVCKNCWPYKLALIPISKVSVINELKVSVQEGLYTCGLV